MRDLCHKIALFLWTNSNCLLMDMGGEKGSGSPDPALAKAGPRVFSMLVELWLWHISHIHFIHRRMKRLDLSIRKPLHGLAIKSEM